MKTEAEYLEEIHDQIQVLNKLLEESASVVDVRLQVAVVTDKARAVKFRFIEWATAGFASAALWAKDPIAEMIEDGNVERPEDEDA